MIENLFTNNKQFIFIGGRAYCNHEINKTGLACRRCGAKAEEKDEGG